MKRNAFTVTVSLICAAILSSALLCSCEGEKNPPQTSSEAPQSSAAESSVAEPASSEEPASVAEESSEEVSAEPELDDFSDFVPVLRFAVMSDTHVSSLSDESAKRLQKVFESAYAYAESSEGYKSLDAVLFAGDLTNSGFAYELKAFKSIINRNVKEGTQIITVMGNHEYYGGGQAAYTAEIDALLNKDIEINGYHFIGLSTAGDNSYASSLTWLDEKLKAANDADAEKPIFVFQHHHIKDTVYVSSEWYAADSLAMNAVFTKYPQVIDFSGHSHGPVNNPTSIWQGKYTCLGTGTLAYFEMTSGMTYGTLPPDKEQAAQYYIVEVGADNRVKIQPYNVLTDTFFKTPSDTDDPDTQLVYYIDKPSDPETFRYTDRKDKSKDPYFGEDAAITVSGETETGVTIEFPQAHDDNCVYSYTITCKCEKGTQTFKYFSEYYFEPMPATMKFTLSGLVSDSEYTVYIAPVDCFGEVGKTIQATFKTKVKETVVYKSENDVKYSGTFTNFDSLAELKLSTSTFAYGGTVNGDVFVGDWSSASQSSASKAALAAAKGYSGSAALEVWANSTENQGLYIFATDANKNTTKYPEIVYLRVWVDFTDIAFRKANFGLVGTDGALFTTDESDGRTDLSFWYMAEGTDTWKEYKHGDDGCFGDAQSSNVKGFKGWMAFPVHDFTYRSGTGKGTHTSGESFGSDTVAGVYMFWDYSENGSYSGKKFYIDEVQLVSDYKVFTEYSK